VERVPGPPLRRERGIACRDERTSHARPRPSRGRNRLDRGARRRACERHDSRDGRGDGTPVPAAGRSRGEWPRDARARDLGRLPAPFIACDAPAGRRPRGGRTRMGPPPAAVHRAALTRQLRSVSPGDRACAPRTGS
jgi:hypothetical protein